MSPLVEPRTVDAAAGEVLVCPRCDHEYDERDLGNGDCPNCTVHGAVPRKKRHPVADRIGKDSAALGWSPTGHALGRYGYLLGLDALDRSLLLAMLSYADAETASMRPAVGRAAVQAGMSTSSATARLRRWVDAGLFERVSGKPTGRPSTYSARGLRVAEGAVARGVLAARERNLREGTHAFERFVREYAAPVLAALREGGHELATPVAISWPPGGQELATMKNHPMKNHEHQESEQSSGRVSGHDDDRRSLDDALIAVVRSSDAEEVPFDAY